MDSSNAATEFDSLEEDWVIVKKQKINIIIPPLPGSNGDPSKQSVNVASDHPAEQLPDDQPALGINKPYPADTKIAPITANGAAEAVDHGGVRSVKQFRHSPGESSFTDGPARFSRMMKASNLERKVVKAGGLSRWLTSLGLEQFIRIFRGRKMSKFQLVNLSMSKLKDMGVHPVGPRRKLIHAIECVCHPYCFKDL